MSAPEFDEFNVGVVAVVAIYAGLFVRGIANVSLFGAVGITIVDVTIALCGLAWLASIALGREVVVGALARRTLALALVFLLYLSVQYLRSPQPLRGFTLLLLVVRDLLLFAILVTSLEKPSLERITKYVSVIAMTVASAMLLVGFYGLVVGFRNTGLFRQMFHISHFPRFMWLVADPNFFALYLSVGLLAAVYVAWSRRSLGFALGAFLISVTILLTWSRTVLLLLPGIAMGIAAPWVFESRRRILAAGGSLLVAGTVVLAIAGEALLFRFTSAHFARLKLWIPLLENADPISVVFGNGLRASETLLGRYPHNSYLEVWFDTGLVGLALFLIVLASLFVPATRAYIEQYPDYGTVWWWAGILVVGFLVPFSFQYRPFVWLVLGLLCVTTQQAGGSPRIDLRAVAAGTVRRAAG